MTPSRGAHASSTSYKDAAEVWDTHSEEDWALDASATHSDRSARRKRKRRRLCICGTVLLACAALASLAGSSTKARELVSSWHSSVVQDVALEASRVQEEEPWDDKEAGDMAETAAGADDLLLDQAEEPDPPREGLQSAVLSYQRPMPLDEDALPDDTARRVFSASTVGELDVELCGRSPCSFLIVGRVNEQETKAQLHLSQMAILAKRLKRTLVLPNVGLGRYAVCRAHSFDFYHDVKALERQFDQPLILWKDFVAYSKRRRELGGELMGQIVVNDHDVVSGSADKIVPSDYNAHRLCAEAADVDWDSHQPVMISPAKGSASSASRRIRYGEWLVSTLRSPAFFKHWSTTSSPRSPDALFIFWGGSRTHFLPLGRKDEAAVDEPVSLPFHPRWQKMVERLATRIQPFVALHWRQEAFTKGVPDFMKCAKQAEEQVKSMSSTKSIFFMTDFPLDGDTQYHSDSYVKFLRTHPAYRLAARLGIDHLAGQFGPGSGYNWTTLFKEDLQVARADGTLVPINSIDTGVNGILDKMMAERAEHYLVGEPYVCGRWSSYAIQIIVERMKRAGQPGSRIKAAVDYFPRAAKHRFEDDLQV